MKYIYTASFLHESNTYSSNVSDLAWFQKRCWKLGDAVFDRFRGVKTEFGGFIDAFAGAEDMVLIPILAAEATPSGPVADDVAARVQKIILDTLTAAPQVDAVLLSLHGAMVTQSSEDGEGDLVQAIRQAVGDQVLIYATLDLHANITEKMASCIDVMIPYDCYPHTDKYQRGLQCAQLLQRYLRGECTPVMAVKKLPLLLPLVSTASEEMMPICSLIYELESQAGVLNAAVAHGFISADIAECGASAVVICDGNREQAQRTADILAKALWDRRAEFSASYCTPEQAAQLCRDVQPGPIVISDGPDNPGGGSYADGTRMLQTLLAHKIPSALVALIYDPDSVARCQTAGEGNFVALELGGKLAPEQLGTPVRCTARVLKLTDGRYRNYGPMNPGLQMDLLGTALLDIGGIRVIVVCNPTQPYDVALLELHGIDPRKEQVIVLKSAVHFRAAYAPIAQKILLLNYPGVCVLCPGQEEMKRCKRPVYPLDVDADYEQVL